jgi:HAD superfamily hydrolase (TIGR01509 family)
MLQAIIFDFDGTILDTELYDYQSWQEIYVQHGATLPFDRWQMQVGTVSADFDPYHLLEELSGRTVDRQAIRERRRQRFLALVDQEPLRPGVVELIATASQAGLRLGVASSATQDWVEGHLVSRRLRHHFGVVRTAADVRQVKPDPELYLSALAALGVEPHFALAIEDSRNGMLAAKRAGMRCLVVPNLITSTLDFSEADHVLESLEDITLHDLFIPGNRS